MPFVVASTTVDKIQNTHISDTPPVVPTVGQLWNDTTQQPPLLKMWNGTEWEAVHTSIKQLDPVAFDDINKMINDAIGGAEQDKNKIQEAIDKANEALKQAGLNDTEITAIKQIQSEDGQKINQIQVNYNGIQESVKDLDKKTESYHTQLAGQITDVVKEQDNLNQQIQTATGNISSVQDSQNNMNQELQTAKETIKQISSKTESNTELINTVKQTSDSNSQKIVDTSGKVSIVEQTLSEQKQIITDNTGKINKATQDIDSANRTISNIDGRVSQVEQKADGISTTVSRVETELNNIQVGGINILRNTELMDDDTYWATDGNTIVENGIATVRSAWGSREYKVDILNEYVQSHDITGKKFMLGVDIMRSTQDVTPNSSVHFYAESTGSNDTLVVKDLSTLPLNKWVRYSIPIILVGPGLTTISGRFRIECNTDTEWKFRHMKLEEGTKATDWSPAPQDKANQSDVNSINQQLQSQQTQINQKPDRTEIIASSNENPRAYFKVGTFSDGPNIGRGYVSVGADYGFFLNTNTFISDGFELSANNISAGLIKAKQPKWMIDGIQNNTIPHDFSDAGTYSSKLNLDNSANGDISLSLYPQLDAPLISGGKYKYTPYSQLNGYSLNFQNLYWTDGNILQKSNPASITGYFDLGDTSNTALRLSAGKIEQNKSDVSLYITTSAPWLQYQQGYDGVVIGRDSSNENKSALFANTLYTNRVQSVDDGNNTGVLVDDRLVVNEGIWDDVVNNGKSSHIVFPTGNGNDRIEFHTAEGDGAYGTMNSYFQMVNGNWSVGGVNNQHHSFVVGGDGYILTISNEEGDNAQGNANATVVASRFVTNSSRALKEDIKPIDNIEQATKDILKVEPKQYLYKGQSKKIEEWEARGKPVNEYQHLDTEINIGLIAEDLDEFESLRPFISKVTDEEGNEGILGIDYSKLTPLLLAVCRRQDDKINELEERLVRIELLMKDLHK